MLTLKDAQIHIIDHIRHINYKLAIAVSVRSLVLDKFTNKKVTKRIQTYIQNELGDRYNVYLVEQGSLVHLNVQELGLTKEKCGMVCAEPDSMHRFLLCYYDNKVIIEENLNSYFVPHIESQREALKDTENLGPCLDAYVKEWNTFLKIHELAKETFGGLPYTMSGLFKHNWYS